MEFAITTLNIEIARIETAIRTAESTVFSCDDTRGGYMPSVKSLRRDIKELKKAIEILSEWEKANPEEAEKLKQMDSPWSFEEKKRKAP